MCYFPLLGRARSKNEEAPCARRITRVMGDMNAILPRYRFYLTSKGFVIEGDDRPPVEVGFQHTALEAHYFDGTGTRVGERFGFFNFGKLLEFVAAGLMREWQPTEGWYGARAWALQQTARGIARRLREQWLRLLAQADPTVTAVHRAIFASTFGDAPLALEPTLYSRNFLVRDILNHSACAIAVRNAWSLTREHPVRVLYQSPAAQELRNLARRMGLEVQLRAGLPCDPDLPAQLDRLEDWKALYSDTGETYRSLNRTLMNLPGRVPHRIVCGLRWVHLERPLLHRLEVLAVGLYAGIRHDREETGESRPDQTHLIQNATVEQIRKAMHRLSQHVRHPLDPRRSGDVRQLVQFLADHPEQHVGNLLGLLERAIHWHLSRQKEHVESLRLQYGVETETQIPPIPLPENEGVRFLDSVGAICAEAERMEHCVASYIDLAVKGNCYLFHVDYRGESATVEVGWEGKVRQAQGPRNQRNRASVWGKRVLGRWAALFPQGTGPAGSRHLGILDPDEIPF